MNELSELSLSKKRAANRRLVQFSGLGLATGVILEVSIRIGPSPLIFLLVAAILGVIRERRQMGETSKGLGLVLSAISCVVIVGNLLLTEESELVVARDGSATEWFAHIRSVATREQFYRGQLAIAEERIASLHQAYKPGHEKAAQFRKELPLLARGITPGSPEEAEYVKRREAEKQRRYAQMSPAERQASVLEDEADQIRLEEKLRIRGKELDEELARNLEILGTTRTAIKTKLAGR